MRSYHKRLEQYRRQKMNISEKIADFISDFCGSWYFFIFHLLWFAVWLLLSFDHTILTLIVSLEAILLMNILLMAQNRQIKKDDLRDETDYQADKHAELMTDEIRKIIKEIQKKSN